jgi:transposase
MGTLPPLTPEQRRELTQLRRRAVGRVAERAQMVLLRVRGYSVKEIATIFELGEDVVRQWLHRYQREGPAGLQDRPRPGRPPRDRLARHIVDTQMSQPPTSSGLIHGFWTAGLLAAFLAARFQLVLAPCSIRRYLHRDGWRWARPRLAPATHAPQGQRKEDPATSFKLAQLAHAIAGGTTLLYLDECDLQLLPVIRARWMKGFRLRIPTPGQNSKRALFGALNGRTGQLHYAVQPRKLAVHFVAFLEQLAQAYPTGAVVLVLDNVITHDAKRVRLWLAQPEHARFQVLWLPKYSAHEYNPIERVWGLMKDTVAANRLHGSIAALVATAEDYFVRTTFSIPHPAAPSVPALAEAA